MLYADALSEPGERSVDKVKQSDERDHVGDDVYDDPDSVRSTYRRRLDNIHLRSVGQPSKASANGNTVYSVCKLERWT